MSNVLTLLIRGAFGSVPYRAASHSEYELVLASVSVRVALGEGRRGEDSALNRMS